MAKRKFSRQPRPITSPIHVFISSSQGEFKKLREDLKQSIDALPIGSRQIFLADLVEWKSGETISEDINEALDSCAIYVLIVGHKDSNATLNEFKDAWIRGIPILIYQYSKRNSGQKRGRTTGLVKFIEKQSDKGLRIRKPESAYHSQRDLIEHVLRDLPDKLGEIAGKYVLIRRGITRKGKFGGGLQ